ncbi:hypothetical protein [Enhygromyxa salina]|uniref:Lipoprotein n=1 Tax=Enhygromyxa salina TaxID=215803 RepID=A0A2S9YVV5_9BACT|nr:hypothetical protein [Enhygromyxa salina]PRQ09235.1 hypothetical protein ENSA7_12250 [Enhygromyxa salina]
MAVAARAPLVIATALLGFASGCWPGRCAGVLRGTPRVSFTGEHQPCTDGPACAEEISPEQGFHQNGDFARVEDPAVLLESAAIGPQSWFLVDEAGAVMPSQITAMQHGSAHSCASAIGFDLVPNDPLAPGVYRLVLMTDRLEWSVLKLGVDASSYAGEPAIVQYYRVPEA